MAVFKMSGLEFNKPQWCRFTNCGLYKMVKGDSEREYHYHDSDEYFIVTEGKAKVLLEGKEYQIGPGDCVCISMYGKHQILKALENLALVFVYDELKVKKRKGHIPVEEGDKCVLPAGVVKMGLWLKEKPDWSRLTDYGIMHFPKGKVEMDYHYHDCYEYYFVTKGSLLIVVEDKEQKIEEGEMCPIRSGYEHKVLEAHEDSTLIYLEEELKGEKRHGHLHYENEKRYKTSLPEELSKLVGHWESTRTKHTELAKLDYRIQLNKKLNPKDYGVGIIGVGRIANWTQIPAYLNAGLNIAAVADIREDTMEGTKNTWNIPNGFLDYRKLLELAEVKVVDVLTPTFPRKQIILDAIKAGKHVISEKPFARSYKNALKMVEAAEKAGVKLAVHQPISAHYPCVLARALIKNGYIGELYSIEYIMHCCEDTDYYESPITRWHAFLDDHLHVENGAHHFDLIRVLSGQTPYSVYCQGTRMPGQNFKSLMANVYAVEFPGAVRAAIIMNHVSQSMTNGALEFSCRIEGTLGTIKMPHISTKLELYSKKIEPGHYEVCWDRVESCIGINGVIGAHGAHMADLVNAVFEDREPISSGRDNLNTVRTCLAAKRSAEEGRPVSIDEIEE